METSRDAFKELTEAATIDLAAALDDIRGSSGFEAILTVIERLEADSALRLARADGAEVPRLQGGIQALQSLRTRLAELHAAGYALAQAAAEDGDARALDRFPSVALELRRQARLDAAEEEQLEHDLSDFTRPGGGPIA